MQTLSAYMTEKLDQVHDKCVNTKYKISVNMQFNAKNICENKNLKEREQESERGTEKMKKKYVEQHAVYVFCFNL